MSRAELALALAIVTMREQAMIDRAPDFDTVFTAEIGGAHEQLVAQFRDAALNDRDAQMPTPAWPAVSATESFDVLLREELCDVGPVRAAAAVIAMAARGEDAKQAAIDWLDLMAQAYAKRHASAYCRHLMREVAQ